MRLVLFLMALILSVETYAAKENRIPRWCRDLIGNMGVTEIVTKTVGAQLVPERLRNTVASLMSATGGNGTLASLANLVKKLSDASIPVQTSLVDLLFKLPPNSFPQQNVCISAVREKILLDLSNGQYDDLDEYPLYEGFAKRSMEAQLFLVEILDSVDMTPARIVWVQEAAAMKGLNPNVKYRLESCRERNANLRRPSPL